MRYFLYIIFLFSASPLFAQTKEVYATGSWEITNITPEQAKSKAIEEAKANALQQAGVSEVFTIMNSETISNQLSYFVSSSNSELSGEITGYKIIKENILTEGVHLLYTVNIRATVRIKKNKRDLEFDAYIQGIKETPYRDGENISFSIHPTKVCYLHIFWFDENGKGDIVYPNKAESSQMLTANESNLFPITQDYKIRKETEEPIESVSIVFVLTKQNIPYTTQNITVDNFHNWVLSIPPALRIIKFNNIFITQ